jgi:hypothetical protein
MGSPFDRLLSYCGAVSAEREKDPLRLMIAEAERNADPITGEITIMFTDLDGTGEVGHPRTPFRRRSAYRQTLARLGWECRDAIRGALAAGPDLDNELFLLIEASGSPRLARLALEATATSTDPFRWCYALQTANLVRATAFRRDFIDALKDRRVEVREFVVGYVQAFVRARGAADVVLALLDVVKDEEAAGYVRSAALNALWRARGRRDVRHVAAALEGSADPDLAACARSLGAVDGVNPA